MCTILNYARNIKQIDSMNIVILFVLQYINFTTYFSIKMMHFHIWNNLPRFKIQLFQNFEKWILLVLLPNLRYGMTLLYNSLFFI